ncbi:hypothetical protein ACHAWF_005659 [Thalassiosira exigua]
MTKTPTLLSIPRPLTAPDAWIAIILASILQFKQYARSQQHRKGKVHAGAKSKPKRQAWWSPIHEWLFTHLQMMTSPLQDQASDLNAEMVDLQSEKDMGDFATKVASGKVTGKKKAKSNRGKGRGGGGSEEKKMEIRSRRIMMGEMIYNGYYPAIETVLNIALSLTVGLVSRWITGLIRSIRLSGASGPCCSPYRGDDDEGSRHPGAFERLLVCVLMKQEGDSAGSLFFSVLLMIFFLSILKLSWLVSDSNSPLVNLNEEYETEKTNEKEGEDKHRYRRIHPSRVKRFLVSVVATLASLMLFHTPPLLRSLGLDGLIEAVEELSARVILFGNVLGIVSLPKLETFEQPPRSVQNLMNWLLLVMAIVWGQVASIAMASIEETARNAAHLLSPHPTKKKYNPKESIDLMNVRMMLIIQAMAPLMVMCTYIFNARFVETTRMQSGIAHSLSFSKRYLRNSGLFVRVALSWCFVGASIYTARALLQSFLDQAATVASAMATLGDVDAKSNATTGGGNKRSAVPSPQQAPTKSDHFSDRYRSLVLTAGRIVSFPAFVFAMLCLAHIRCGDGSTHPGVGYESQPKDLPRLLARGLFPPYSDKYILRITRQREQHRDALIQTAALTRPSWDVSSPFRDSAHKKVVNIFGSEKLCYPPEERSIKAMGRHVDFLLKNDNSNTFVGTLTANPLTGLELLDVATGFLPDGTGAQGSCNDVHHEASPTDNNGGKECELPGDSRSFHRFMEVFSHAISHNFLTPTVVFPIVETFCFLSSVWWNCWYSLLLIVYYVKLRKSTFLRITP